MPEIMKFVLHFGLGLDQTFSHDKIIINDDIGGYRVIITIIIMGVSLNFTIHYFSRPM